jgi:hypothetical protein
MYIQTRKRTIICKFYVVKWLLRTFGDRTAVSRRPSAEIGIVVAAMLSVSGGAASNAKQCLLQDT